MTHSVFLPHYGLGHNNWVRVALPRSFYRDPVPLLLCDRVYIDESVFIADDFGDAPAYRLLEELRSANVVDTMEFSATVTLDDTFWNLWPEMQSAVLGSVALPPQRGITHPHDALRGWNDLSSENANRPEAEEVFQLAVEAWYTLAVVKCRVFCSFVTSSGSA